MEHKIQWSVNTCKLEILAKNVWNEYEEIIWIKNRKDILHFLITLLLWLQYLHDGFSFL